MANILIIEDEPILAKNISQALSLSGHEAQIAGTGEEGLEMLEENPIDLVLLDYRLPGIDGMDVLRELSKRGLSSTVVMMTAHGNIDTAVEVMREGAVDFITKPLDLKALDLIVDRALSTRKAAANLSYFRERERAQSALEQVIGESPSMLAVKQFVIRLVGTQALASESPPSVLITGETGTGKDLVARAIHYAGSRREGQFVQVNCTALPDHLVESELFGHVRGAFTDARGDKRGLLETADGGTLFLDEIGHMQPGLQAKLLGVLEQRVIRPVGGTSDRAIDIHVIAATNRDLEEAIESRSFREDLYHRLRVLSVHMPPLRDRADDVVSLAEHFRRICSARFSLETTGFSAEAMTAIQAYDWPGNVRELSHAVESAVLMTDGPIIQPEHLNIRPAGQQAQMGLELSATQQVISIDFGDNSPKLDEIEYNVIIAALEHSRHNLSRAARLLGISRDAVRYRLEKYRSNKPDVDVK